jgi:hypothetical protein
MARTRRRRRGIAKRLAAAITVCLVVSVGVGTPAGAKTKPKGQSKVDLHALIACTGLDVSASRLFFLGQGPDPNLVSNVITGFTRSKTKGAHKQAAKLRATTGDAQFAAINKSLKWCTSLGYKLRPH